MAIETTFTDLGTYIGDQNPYSLTPNIPPTLGEEGGPGVLTVSAEGSDPWMLYWGFREPAAGTVDGHAFDKWDVVNYRIIRTIIVPTWYTWIGGSKPTLFEHLLIGFTPPRSSTASLTFMSYPDTPAGNGSGTYSLLGSLIEERFPLSTEARLDSMKDTSGNLSNIVTAVSFLESKSKASGNVFQRDSDGLNLSERQQCLYWDGPEHTPVMPPAPTSAMGVVSASTPYRVAKYQITKAFRIGYFYEEKGTTYRGDILVGYNGSGDG
jgi:hypothetical protein